MKLAILLRRTLYILLGKFDQLIGRKNNLIVFCYHSINNDGWRYGVSVSEFKKQINYLSNHFQFINTDELGKVLLGKKQLKQPSVVITFDDGYADILAVKDFLHNAQINPTAFVIADSKKANKGQLQTNRRLLTTKEIKDLAKIGWSIGSHSMTHADFGRLYDSSVESEVVDSKQKLEKDLSMKVNMIAYPKGKYNESITEKAECYNFGFSMDDKLINSSTNILTIPRIGVDRSHSLNEFKYLASPSVLIVRGMLKNILGGVI